MNITTEQFMAKLAASPADAREFDSYAPAGVSRRAHAELILARVNSSCANIASSKRLADQRVINATLKSDLAKATARLKFLTPEKTVRHNLHAAPGKKLPVGPAKPSAYIKPVANAPAKVSAAPIKAIAPAAKSCLGNTNLSKVSAFFAAQAR
jgi:hypothetical protein